MILRNAVDSNVRKERRTTTSNDSDRPGTLHIEERCEGLKNFVEKEAACTAVAGSQQWGVCGSIRRASSELARKDTADAEKPTRLSDSAQTLVSPDQAGLKCSEGRYDRTRTADASADERPNTATICDTRRSRPTLLDTATDLLLLLPAAPRAGG